MLHTIHSDSLKVSIKQVGMELCSIKNKQTGVEYIWQGDPRFWTGQAPVLFPIIGSQKDDKTIFDGREFAIPKHGIIRNSTKPKLIHRDTNTAIFQFHWDDDTLEQYPFKFVFEVTFQIKGKQLEISHTVRNHDTRVMPFNLGGHPAFNCQVNDHIKYSDYYIEFNEIEDSESWLLNNNGLITDNSKTIFNSDSILRLNNHLFDEDALIFRDLKSTSATLTCDKAGEILRVEFSDFPYLGIWAKPKAPYVCIEPWIGIADHVNSNGEFNTKEQLRVLTPGNEETLRYSITILE